jgi:hypothetical protein
MEDFAERAKRQWEMNVAKMQRDKEKKREEAEKKKKEAYLLKIRQRK